MQSRARGKHARGQQHGEPAHSLLAQRLPMVYTAGYLGLRRACMDQTSVASHCSPSSSSSNSPSSSAVASWYCWYSDTKSFMLLSASVNSISPMPSPVYQCRKALRLNMAVKYSATRLNISWIAVEFPRKATAIFNPIWRDIADRALDVV